MSRRFFSRLRQGLGGIATMLALAGAAPPAGETPYPPNTVLMFVAGWCAPCHGEITRLDEIAAAARPFAIRVVLFDDMRAGREMMRGVAPERRWQPDPATLRRIKADLFADTAGLPYSVAIDAEGHPCADRRDGLDGARTRLLVQRCAIRH